MACSGCGSVNCSGCGCAQAVNATGYALTPVNPCVSSCVPQAGCSSASPASATPYYGSCSPCPEDNTEQVVNNYYRAAVCFDNSWNIPACDGQITLVSSDTKVLVVGAYLWHPEYGYFKIVGFNATTGQITILNECQEGNAAVGTSIPACTCFVVTDTPIDLSDQGQICVTVSFIAPNVGVCIVIAVTSTATISAGDLVVIGSGQYRVNSVVSSTLLEICNDGQGILPGTSVVALNASGEYQYCLTLLQTCCSQLLEEVTDLTDEINELKSSFGGVLPTPCSDYENEVLQGVTVAVAAVNTTIDDGTLFPTSYTLTSNLLNINNPSTCRTLKYVAMPIIQLSGYIQTLTVLGATVTATYSVTLEVNINGAGWTSINSVNKGFIITLGGTESFRQRMADIFSVPFFGTVPALGAVTIQFRLVFAFVAGTAAITNMNIDTGTNIIVTANSVAV